MTYSAPQPGQPNPYGAPQGMPPAQPQYSGPPAYGQAAYGQPAYGQAAQAPAGQGGSQGIALDTKFWPIAWVFHFMKPTIKINGHPVPAQWGVNHIPLPPGQHHVHVHVPYILPSELGPADLMVNVAPQQTTPLEYRAPAWAFSQGSMGPAPQAYNGVGITLAMIAVPFVILFLFFLLMIVAAAI